MSCIWHHEKNTTLTELHVNLEVIPPLKNDESFKYLRRYFNFSMNNQTHREELLETTTAALNKSINYLFIQTINLIFILGTFQANYHDI